MTHERRVEPELLDSLGPEDPSAIRSRRDLRRVHLAMRSLSILKSTISSLALGSPPRRILELGAGDGSLMLRLARSFGLQWPNVQLTLLDRTDVVDSATREAYELLGWSVSLQCADVFAWAGEAPTVTYDLCVANLFLHHFSDASLGTLLTAVSRRSRAFVACEPRRNRFSRWSSRCVGLIGGNHVTREDAVKSVDAGFTGRELSERWPASHPGWSVREFSAFPFTHCFTAARARAEAA